MFFSRRKDSDSQLESPRTAQLRRLLISDWYFMGGNGQSTVTPGASTDAFVTTNQANGSKSMLTMPMVPYINATPATNCSYPRSLYPNQQSWNPYTMLPDGSQCENGKDASGNVIADTDIALNNIPNSPDYQQNSLRLI